MSTPSSSLAQLIQECQPSGLGPETARKLAVLVASEFQALPEEVGILRREQESLVFVHPAELHGAGRIPLNNANSVAVRTCNSKRPEIMNNFAKTRHTTFFEMVDIGGTGPRPKIDKDRQIIQKLMSAPVVSSGKAVGVIQVCRKGPTLIGAGPDFQPADLQRLVAIASAVEACFK